MGAWDIGSFDNDGALDFVAEVKGSTSLEPICALARAINKRRAEDSDADIAVYEEAEPMIAGGEIIAILAGYPVDSLPSSVEALKADNTLTVDVTQVPVVITAIQQIYTNSELRELWEESNDFEAWQNNVNDLLTRLKQIN